MNIFTQLVYVVGKLTPTGVQMLGTGFLVSKEGHIVTSHHVTGSENSNLVVLAPHISDINSYQDIDNNQCTPLSTTITDIDPIHDLAILKADMSFNGELPKIGSFDDCNIGDAVGIFGFPHCAEGPRRTLTYQQTLIGAKVLLTNERVKTKHAVINSQARPGQSGSLVFSLKNNNVAGVLVGAWAPTGNAGGIRLGNIDPAELHQTTHCVSAEYIKDML